MKPSVLADVYQTVVYSFYGRVLELERSKMSRALQLGRSETVDRALE